MFFIVSKVFWGLVQPVSLTFLLLLAGWLLVTFGRRRTGLWLGAVGLVIFGLCSFTTLGVLLIGPLEARFVRPTPLPSGWKPIIMLGGATAARVSTRRQIAELTEAGDPPGGYLATGGALSPGPHCAQRRGWPAGGRWRGRGGNGAAVFVDQGVAPERLVLESSSRQYR